MPTIGLLSDLHFEFHADGGREFIRQVIRPLGQQVDVLVLAGDITSGHSIRPVLTHICDLVEAVVFVPGNHEFYNTSVMQLFEKLWRIDHDIPNLIWLDNNVAEVAGLRFVGGTLWFPKPEGLDYARRHAVNDFNLIKGFEPWVYNENHKCEAVMRMAAKTADVVVTHHVPCLGGNAPEYRNSPLNPFFVCDLSDLIEKAKPPLWLYGHTHSSRDVVVGQTRLLCNPFGYPHEPKKDYRQKLLIKVGQKEPKKE